MREQSRSHAGELAERDLAYRIAQQVHDARTNLGWSQSDLASEAGMRQPNVSRLEAARNLPKLDVLHRIAEAMGAQLVVRFEWPADTPSESSADQKEEQVS